MKKLSIILTVAGLVMVATGQAGALTINVGNVDLSLNIGGVGSVGMDSYVASGLTIDAQTYPTAVTGTWVESDIFNQGHPDCAYVMVGLGPVGSPPVPPGDKIANPGGTPASPNVFGMWAIWVDLAAGSPTAFKVHMQDVQGTSPDPNVHYNALANGSGNFDFQIDYTPSGGAGGSAMLTLNGVAAPGAVAYTDDLSDAYLWAALLYDVGATGSATYDASFLGLTVSGEGAIPEPATM
ncbi:MAG: hypothetical protein ISS78_09055, partial [Phycisphaerae bacterium]|nr:hypothetical protein [Phycisphaerae bacterium]